MEVESVLEKLKEQIEAKLNEILPRCPELFYGTLSESCRYSLLAPAKRLRPLLLLSVTEAYGVAREKALLPACALELIHTYSLIHDDLPCMDDDDFRRGIPSLHKAFSEWQALLTGDALLTSAFELLASAPGLDAEMKISLIANFAKAAGAHGMIGGQMIDLLTAGKAVDEEILLLKYRHKTALLIQAALTGGALLSSASNRELALFQEMGERIGIAFQLVDDILDCDGESQKEDARLRIEFHLGAAQKALKQLEKSMPLLEALFEKMVYRTV